MGCLGAFLAELAALAVIISPILFDDDHKVVDKLIDLRFLFIDKLLILRETVTALHIHNCHVSDRLFLVVRAFDSHDSRDILVLDLIVIKERGLACVEISFDRLPAVFLEPLRRFFFTLAVSDKDVTDVFAAAFRLFSINCRRHTGRRRKANDHGACQNY